jgi:hypothetical protein
VRHNTLHVIFCIHFRLNLIVIHVFVILIYQGSRIGHVLKIVYQDDFYILVKMR